MTSASLGNTTTSQVKGPPLATVRPPDSNYPYDGTDLGPSINAAGLALKNAHGGTVMIRGGVNLLYPIKTQVIFYDTVNYIGDGAYFQAQSGLANPFTTDTATPYKSGQISGLTLDGGNVAGTTVFACPSAQESIFSDLVVKNASVGLGIIVSRGAHTYTNSSALPQIIQLNSNGATVSAISANSHPQSGAVLTETIGLFCVLPGNALQITYTGATPILTQCAIGVLMNCQSGVLNASNTFVNPYVTNCQVGPVHSGDVAGSRQCTNNVYTNLIQDTATVAAIIFAGNTDSNVMTRAKLRITANNAIGIWYNACNPTADARVYFNVIEHASVDTLNPNGQIGVVTGKNTQKPNVINRFQPDGAIPTSTVVLFAQGANIKVVDYTNGLTVLTSQTRSGSSWTPETYPGSGSGFKNVAYFPMLLLIGGGTITAISVKDQVTGLTSGIFYLKPEDFIKCISSVNPTTFTSLLFPI